MTRITLCKFPLFSMWVLGCTTNFFIIYKKIENWNFVNVALVGLLNFFPIHERDGLLGFLIVSLGSTSKFLRI